MPLLPSRGDLEGESNHYIGPRPKTGDKRKEAEIDDEYLLQLQVRRGGRGGEGGGGKRVAEGEEEVRRLMLYSSMHSQIEQTEGPPRQP